MEQFPSHNSVRILSIDPTIDGLAFAVLEGTDCLVDWGVKAVRLKDCDACLFRASELMERYDPTVVVLNSCEDSRRPNHVRTLVKGIAELAKTEGAKVRRISNREVKIACCGSALATKHDVSLAVALRFRELVPFLPRQRKPWMSEDYRAGVFEAAALAEAYLRSTQKKGIPS